MARHAYPHLHGGCTCGAFSFETSKAPVARFVCHCLFCQDFTGEAFSDVSVLMAHHVHMKGAGALTHKKYRLPPNLNRTRPTTFEFLINRKTAKQLGFDVPPGCTTPLRHFCPSKVEGK